MSFEKLPGVAPGAPVEALLFDLDGTLLDSVPDLATAIDRMLVELGHAPAGRERVAAWVGDGARQLVIEALRFAAASLDGADVNRALAVFQRHYAACLSVDSCLFAGTLEALRHWREAGLRMACVTNKGARFTEPLIDHFGLRELLPVVVSGDTLPQRKPDPAPLLEACRRLEVPSRHALMIGDSRNDVRAARAAGMPVICVRHGYNHGRSIEGETPDLIVDSLSALITPFS